MTDRPAGKGPLAAVHYWILGGWTAAAVVLTVGILISSREAEGWEGLVAIVGLMFLFASMFILGATAVITRFLVTGRNNRTVFAAVFPPLVMLLVGVIAAA